MHFARVLVHHIPHRLQPSYSLARTHAVFTYTRHRGVLVYLLHAGRARIKSVSSRRALRTPRVHSVYVCVSTLPERRVFKHMRVDGLSHARGTDRLCLCCRLSVKLRRVFCRKRHRRIVAFYALNLCCKLKCKANLFYPELYLKLR